MTKRTYRIGFESPGITSGWSSAVSQQRPDAVFVTGSAPPFAFGEVVCACPSQREAEEVLAALRLYADVKASLASREEEPQP